MRKKLDDLAVRGVEFLRVPASFSYTHIHVLLDIFADSPARPTSANVRQIHAR
jgi:hypothetical protein